MTTPAVDIHLAARQGKVDKMWSYVRGGGDVYALDKHGNTPLHVASFYGKLESVQALLEAGAHPCTLNKLGDPPVFWARQNGHEDIATLLESMANGEWKLYRNEEGHLYYYNAVTGESQWAEEEATPHDQAQPQSHGEGYSHSHQDAPQAQEYHQAPSEEVTSDDWELHLDEASGHAYYTNSQGESIWAEEFPAHQAAAAKAKAAAPQGAGQAKGPISWRLRQDESGEAYFTSNPGQTGGAPALPVPPQAGAPAGSLLSGFGFDFAAMPTPTAPPPASPHLSGRRAPPTVSVSTGHDDSESGESDDGQEKDGSMTLCTPNTLAAHPFFGKQSQGKAPAACKTAQPATAKPAKNRQGTVAVQSAAEEDPYTYTRVTMEAAPPRQAVTGGHRAQSAPAPPPHASHTPPHSGHYPGLDLYTPAPAPTTAPPPAPATNAYSEYYHAPSAPGASSSPPKAGPGSHPHQHYKVPAPAPAPGPHRPASPVAPGTAGCEYEHHSPSAPGPATAPTTAPAPGALPHPAGGDPAALGGVPAGGYPAPQSPPGGYPAPQSPPVQGGGVPLGGQLHEHHHHHYGGAAAAAAAAPGVGPSAPPTVSARPSVPPSMPPAAPAAEAAGASGSLLEKLSSELGVSPEVLLANIQMSKAAGSPTNATAAAAMGVPPQASPGSPSPAAPPRPAPSAHPAPGTEHAAAYPHAPQPPPAQAYHQPPAQIPTAYQAPPAQAYQAPPAQAYQAPPQAHGQPPAQAYHQPPAQVNQPPVQAHQPPAQAYNPGQSPGHHGKGPSRHGGRGVAGGDSSDEDEPHEVLDAEQAKVMKDFFRNMNASEDPLPRRRSMDNVRRGGGRGA